MSSIDVISSAVTSRRLIVTSYNLAIIRFWYPATNNRDSVFTGSKHHVFTKVPVLETPSFLHLPLFKLSVCLFMCKSWVFVIFWCLCASFLWHPIVCTTTTNWIGVRVSLAIPLCHWSRLFVTVLKLHHDYSVSIFPTRDSTSNKRTVRLKSYEKNLKKILN